MERVTEKSNIIICCFFACLSLISHLWRWMIRSRIISKIYWIIKNTYVIRCCLCLSSYLFLCICSSVFSSLSTIRVTLVSYLFFLSLDFFDFSWIASSWHCCLARIAWIRPWYLRVVSPYSIYFCFSSMSFEFLKLGFQFCHFYPRIRVCPVALFHLQI